MLSGACTNVFVFCMFFWWPRAREQRKNGFCLSLLTGEWKKTRDFPWRITYWLNQRWWLHGGWTMPPRIYRQLNGFMGKDCKSNCPKYISFCLFCFESKFRQNFMFPGTFPLLSRCNLMPNLANSYLRSSYKLQPSSMFRSDKQSMTVKKEVKGVMVNQKNVEPHWKFRKNWTGSKFQPVQNGWTGSCICSLKYLNFRENHV